METIEESSSEKNISRRSLLRALGVGAVVTAAGAALAGCGGSSSSSATAGDVAILNATAIAEAVSAVLYANLVTSSPLYTALASTPNSSGQSFLVAAYQQEVAHYNLLLANGATAVASTQAFYYPATTFSSTSQALSTIQIIEDFLIAIYLFGVNNLSSGTYRQYYAQILGVQSEHRALGRVAANYLGVSSLTTFAQAGQEETGSGHAANNYEYERLFAGQITSLTSITDILTDEFSTLGGGGSYFSETQYLVGTLLPILQPTASQPQITNSIPAIDQDISVVTST